LGKKPLERKPPVSSTHVPQVPWPLHALGHSAEAAATMEAKMAVLSMMKLGISLLWGKGEVLHLIEVEKENIPVE